jgi:hypothetical protein
MKRNKLSLNRETVQCLTPSTLDDVAGGTVSAISMASLRFCRYTPAISRAAGPVGGALKWVWDHAKPANTANVSGRGECTA